MRLLSLLILTCCTLITTTGCITESLYDANLEYSNPTREIARPNRKLIGSYVGTDYCNGTLSEIYQFESPFTQNGEPKLLEVQFPVYGITPDQPVRAFETRRVRPFEERAELWFWHQCPPPNPKRVADQTLCRRVDIIWRRHSQKVDIERYIPSSGVNRYTAKCTDLTIPWRERSRIIYAARNLGYAVTVPTDTTMYAAFYTGLAIGYSFMVCPTGTIYLLAEIL